MSKFDNDQQVLGCSIVATTTQPFIRTVSVAVKIKKCITWRKSTLLKARALVLHKRHQGEHIAAIAVCTAYENGTYCQEGTPLLSKSGLQFQHDNKSVVGTKIVNNNTRDGVKQYRVSYPLQYLPMVLTCIVFSASPSGTSSNCFPDTIPALFTRMSTPPKSSFTWSTDTTAHQHNMVSASAFELPLQVG